MLNCEVHCTPSCSVFNRPCTSSRPLFFFFFWKPERKHCLSVSMATNTPLHGSSQKHSVKWQLLLDLLSNKRSLWACLFITTTQTFTRLFTMFRDQRQGGGKKKRKEKSGKLCLCHFFPLNVYLWFFATPEWTRLNPETSRARWRKGTLTALLHFCQHEDESMHI